MYNNEIVLSGGMARPAFVGLLLVSIQSFSIVLSSKRKLLIPAELQRSLPGENKLGYTTAPSQATGFFTPFKFRVRFVSVGCIPASLRR